MLSIGKTKSVMEINVCLRKWMRKGTRICTVLVLTGILISCGGVGDTTRTVVRTLNPVNWFGDEEDEKKAKSLSNKTSEKGNSRLPRLASVPPRPKPPSPGERTRKIARGLAADSENARYTDQQLRQSTAVFGGQARPPRIADSPMSARRNPAISPTSQIARPGPSVKPSMVSQQKTSSHRQNTAALRRPNTVQQPRVSSPSPNRVLLPRVNNPSVPPLQNYLSPPPVKRYSKKTTSKNGSMRLERPPPSIRRPDQKTMQGTAASRYQSQAVSNGFITPSGNPLQIPKPPPAATPIGGGLMEKSVNLAPPTPAKVQSKSSEVSSRERSAVTSGIEQVATIYFDDGSAQLSSEDVSILRTISDYVQQTRGTLRIIGHSSLSVSTFDSKQRESANYLMSLRRANAVADELARQGVTPEDMEVIAKGDREPIYAETLETGAAHNRRTEIYIDYNQRS